MFYRVSLAGLCASLLLVPARGEAAPVTATIAPQYSTTDSPANHVVPSGGFFDGVGDFIINNSTRCSSGLLADGLHVLTAAHCVTTPTGADNFTFGRVTFFGDSGNYTIGVDEVFVHSGWTGSLNNGNDIAVLRLNSVVDSEITRYNIYRGSDEIGQVGDKVGFGLRGTGANGSTPNSSGTKRTVQNTYDVAGLGFAPFNYSTDILIYDFDNGQVANDALGSLIPSIADPVGVGINEGISAPGDSGGPTFLNNMIAGLTSFGASFNFGSGLSPDIDNALNSSFGEIAGDTRVSSFASFIDGFVETDSVPAPFGVLLLATGLLSMVGLRHRRI